MPHLSFLTPSERRRLAESMIKGAKEDPKEVLKAIRTIPKDEPAKSTQSRR